MKKLLIGFVVLIVAGAIFFTINRSVDKAVNLKIEELNQNGFSITQNNSNLPMKIRKDGEIQVIDAIKALDFIVKNIEESQAKEVFVEFLNIFDSQSKQLALEGTKFDYDFSLNIFTKEMKADLYLKELSVLDDESAKELIMAFNILNSLKLKASLEKLDKKEKIDNFVNPNRLTIMEKDLLKESFKIVNKLKKRLENHFKLNYV
jgi:hypothetical protein